MILLLLTLLHLSLQFMISCQTLRRYDMPEWQVSATTLNPGLSHDTAAVVFYNTPSILHYHIHLISRYTHSGFLHSVQKAFLHSQSARLASNIILAMKLPSDFTALKQAKATVILTAYLRCYRPRYFITHCQKHWIWLGLPPIRRRDIPTLATIYDPIHAKTTSAVSDINAD